MCFGVDSHDADCSLEVTDKYGDSDYVVENGGRTELFCQWRSKYDAEDLQTYPVERHGLSGAGTPKLMISTQATQLLASACM